MNQILKRIKLFDFAVILFCLLTGFYILIGYKQLDNILNHILIRVILLLIIFTILRFGDSNNKIFQLFRNFYPILLIGFFYSETDYYNNLIFEDFDSILVNFESLLFGCQPSLEFSNYIPYRWFSEIMHFGYFSFYFISFGIPLLYYFKARIEFEKTIFILISSFFFYYLIFIIFPSVDPQFYFSAEQITVPDAYLFKYLMDIIITNFETQTGAFPSSHVGISVILLILTRKRFKVFFYILIPLVSILFLSTIYLKAHYVIDILGGIISGILFYWISNKIYYQFLNFKKEN
ncbi:MAG: phosphatase PAP2 family protein [Bacteroidales bacterium]|nr:phosphatase PAP2 family protein [Bacteroidales bacterium]